MWFHMPVSSAFGKLRQNGHKFEASLGCISKTVHQGNSNNKELNMSINVLPPSL